MRIITHRREFLQSLTPALPKKISTLFSFGYDTLVAREIISTRANARNSVHPWITAKSKMWRLLGNTRVVLFFPTLLAHLSLVNKDDVISVDFSDFNGMQVLMFAKQTKRGRALPLYFEVLEYPIEQGSQNLFVNAAIMRFYAHAGCTPALVFDRGFACPSIIQFLARNKYTFIIRLKKRKSLTDKKSGTVLAAEEFKKNDVRVTGWGKELRLVRSDDPRNGNDPWYLITNDTDATRDAIIEHYYHRFEIEEFFRDAKRVLRLEWVRFKTTQSLSVAVWFAMLTCWLFDDIAENLTNEQEAERRRWGLSRFRYMYEMLNREMLRAWELWEPEKRAV